MPLTLLSPANSFPFQFAWRNPRFQELGSDSLPVIKQFVDDFSERYPSLLTREGAAIADIRVGLLQACHIRKGLLLCSSWETILEASNASDFPEWLTFIEDSKGCAERDFLNLEDQMAELGWAVKNILLSTREQTRYSFIDD